MAPGGIVDTIRDAWNGGEIDVTDREAIEARRRKEAEWDAYQRKYEGKAFDGTTGAMRSAPYSLGTMGASIEAISKIDGIQSLEKYRHFLVF